MTRLESLEHRFVALIPADLDPGVLYVTMGYATAVHSCACGCGGRVVTPFTPRDWELHFDGETVSLWPSIGNWNFACQSHYWIRRNRIEWAVRWSAAEISHGRELAREAGGSRAVQPSIGVSEPPRWRRLPRSLRRLARAVRGA